MALLDDGGHGHLVVHLPQQVVVAAPGGVLPAGQGGGEPDERGVHPTAPQAAQQVVDHHRPVGPQVVALIHHHGAHTACGQGVQTPPGGGVEDRGQGLLVQVGQVAPGGGGPA